MEWPGVHPGDGTDDCLWAGLPVLVHVCVCMCEWDELAGSGGTPEGEWKLTVELTAGGDPLVWLPRVLP